MINPSKLSFYSEFKNYYKLEKYLTTIKNGHKRQTVTKLRISNHTLMIEQDRLQNTPRHERLCRVYNSGEIELEEHFTMSCEAYHNLRKTFTSTLTNMNFKENEPCITC